MSEDQKKANALSDRALEHVMRDVISGLRDVSIQLGNEYLKTASVGATLATQSNDEIVALDSGDLKKT